MQTELLIDSIGPDIRRRTGITAPDEFFYIKEASGKETVFFDAREFEVQKKKLEALGSTIVVEALEPYTDRARGSTLLGSMGEKTLFEILRAKNITEVKVSDTVPYGWALALQRDGITVTPKNFSAERVHKTAAEFEHMRRAQQATDDAFALAKKILSESTIVGNTLQWQGAALTSERMKVELETHFLQRGLWSPSSMIVACGEQSARPHDEGEGELRPNELIIVDLFPQDRASGYFADMTRTFCKGQPSPKQAALYAAVQQAQAAVLAAAAPGVACKALHQIAIDIFAKLGFETSPKGGFMHGTGHGLGLAIHEGPRINKDSTNVLEPGMVVTVEPGLYYPELGGVRLEDVIFVHETSVENITKFEKGLIIT